MRYPQKIISGGQTGADRAGLEAARELGLMVGGYVPQGYLTEKGPDLSLKEFGMIETKSQNYRQRTQKNVAWANGTIIFGNPESAGSRLTRTLCAGREVFLGMDWTKEIDPTDISAFQRWLSFFRVSILNVAGNRESVNPGIFAFTKAFLIQALSIPCPPLRLAQTESEQLKSCGTTPRIVI